jgi:predicted RNase H-like HicB family nuclease
MTSYVGLFRGSRDEGWDVTFPDLPECRASGASFKEAFEAAREAISRHLEEIDDPPRPRNTAEILIDAQRDRTLSRAFVGAVMHWVPCEVPDDPAPVIGGQRLAGTSPELRA